MPNNLKFDLFFLVLLILLAASYSFGLSGDFIFDDITNIVMAPALRLEELDWYSIKEVALSGMSGKLQRPIAVTSFAINYYFIDGLDPFWFKWTNVAIHILNGVLVYLLVVKVRELLGSSAILKHYKWLDSPAFPFLVAALWVIHPLHVSTVLYAVQRMTLLSATFCLLAMIFYLKARVAVQENRLSCISYIALTGLALIAGIFSKENAALGIFYILLLEWSLFGFYAGVGRWTKLFLWVVIGVGIVIPFTAAALYSLISPEWFLEGYRNRDFSLAERLLTQSRLFWIYIGWIIFPDISNYGMHHDDIVISSSLFEPWATFFFVSLTALCLVVSVIAFRRLGGLSFGFLFFFFGHSMESSFIPLEMVFEHRNYLPSLGIIIILVSCMFVMAGFLKQQGLKRVISVFPFLLIVVMTFSTFTRADKWGDPLFSTRLDVENHPLSARSHHSYAVNLTNYTNVIANDETIIHHYQTSSELDSIGISGHYGQIIQSIRLQRPVSPILVSDMLERLSYGLTRAETVHFLNDLVRKCLKIECEPYFPNDVLKSMLNAARLNPGNLKKRHIDFNLIWVNYLVGYENDINSSLPILTDLVKLDPDNRTIQEYLVQIYAIGKSDDEQRKLLDMLAETKIGARYPSMIDDLERKIYSTESRAKVK